MYFNDLKLIPALLNTLEEQGYKTPTPIQAQAIPVILEGRDVLGCAQTGTGKTAAFALPTLQRLSQNIRSSKTRAIRCLILTPTRELAVQIGESFKTYGASLQLKSNVIFGGVNQHSQVQSLKSGIDILVATPGRLLDLMSQGYVKLDQVEIFTLDEADRMLDMGFLRDVQKVIAKLPKKRQSLFFSATMSPDIITLAHQILQKPVQISVTPVASTAETIAQKVLFVEKKSKNAAIIYLLKEFRMNSVLVFTRTKHGADKVVKYLVKEGIESLAIHGNKSQNARQNALKLFSDRKIQVLVATDIAARGIDIDDLCFVINYDLPNESESYVHRIGRTGRAGAKGRAFSLCDTDERAFLRSIQKLIKMDIPVHRNHPFEGKVSELIPMQPPVKKERIAPRPFRGRNQSNET